MDSACAFGEECSHTRDGNTKENLIVRDHGGRRTIYSCVCLIVVIVTLRMLRLITASVEMTLTARKKTEATKNMKQKLITFGEGYSKPRGQP